ncbi:uncharacterized protein BDZ99DRAFT_518654 [Mytilinidion resinicola]|uniref:Uncharacterized protein n=1 Tax=Mytilinidion resinicola TaxID=574789 RepID=A0A6A6YTS9_9PEZI|nr:uncharacterized protein BDZ99DRAFT_518654 [Mytilinidion resinicola]KAF2811375.1 hypothetical protein BDZ99DRAFT_518654 [Mytilinidion resinicola]
MLWETTNSSELEAAFPTSTISPTLAPFPKSKFRNIALIVAAIIVMVLATVVVVVLLCILRRRKRKARADMDRGFENESGFRSIPLQQLIGPKMAHVLIKDPLAKPPTSPKHDPRFAIGDDADSDDEGRGNREPNPWGPIGMGPKPPPNDNGGAPTGFKLPHPLNLTSPDFDTLLSPTNQSEPLADFLSPVLEPGSVDYFLSEQYLDIVIIFAVVVFVILAVMLFVLSIAAHCRRKNSAPADVENGIEQGWGFRTIPPSWLRGLHTNPALQY